MASSVCLIFCYSRWSRKIQHLWRLTWTPKNHFKIIPPQKKKSCEIISTSQPSYVPWSKLLVLGMVIQPLIGNPYNGYINPYYWVDDHPLLYGNNGSLDPGTYKFACIHSWLFLPILSGIKTSAPGKLRFPQPQATTHKHPAGLWPSPDEEELELMELMCYCWWLKSCTSWGW